MPGVVELAGLVEPRGLDARVSGDDLADPRLRVDERQIVFLGHRAHSAGILVFPAAHGDRRHQHDLGARLLRLGGHGANMPGERGGVAFRKIPVSVIQVRSQEEDVRRILAHHRSVVLVLCLAVRPPCPAATKNLARCRSRSVALSPVTYSQRTRSSSSCTMFLAIR